jgi:hypothetical protein
MAWEDCDLTKKQKEREKEGERKRPSTVRPLDWKRLALHILQEEWMRRAVALAPADNWHQI